MVKIVGGGRADGNRTTSREPTQRTISLTSIELTTKGSITAGALVHLSMGDIAAALMETEKPLAEQPGFRVVIPGTIEFVQDLSYLKQWSPKDWKAQRESVVPGNREVFVPGIDLVDESPERRAVIVNIGLLYSFLSHESEHGLIAEAREKEWKLPAVTGGDRHENLLAGLTADVRADLGDLRRSLNNMINAQRF